MYGENIKTTESAGGTLSAMKGFAQGVLAGAVFTVLAFALFAFLLAYTKLPEQSVPVIAVSTEGIGAAIAGFAAAKGAKSRGFFTGLISGVLYMGMIWMISLLSGSGITMGSHLFTMLGVSASSGALGGIFGVNTEDHVTNRRRR